MDRALVDDEDVPEVEAGQECPAALAQPTPEPHQLHVTSISDVSLCAGGWWCSGVVSSI